MPVVTVRNHPEPSPISHEDWPQWRDRRRNPDRYSVLRPQCPMCWGAGKIMVPSDYRVDVIAGFSPAAILWPVRCDSCTGSGHLERRAVPR